MRALASRKTPLIIIHPTNKFQRDIIRKKKRCALCLHNHPHQTRRFGGDRGGYHSSMSVKEKRTRKLVKQMFRVGDLFTRTLP